MQILWENSDFIRMKVFYQHEQVALLLQFNDTKWVCTVSHISEYNQIVCKEHMYSCLRLRGSKLRSAHDKRCLDSHSVHWSINPPSKTPSPSFLPSPSPLDHPPPPPRYWLFVTPPPSLENRIFPWTPRILKFFIPNSIF